MTGSLNRALLILLASAGMAVAAPQPHMLVAPQLDTENDTEATTPDTEAGTPADDAEDRPVQTISVQPMAKPSIEGFGTVESGTGGSSSAWKGSTRESADGLLALLHSGVANDTLRELVTRLLMTQAPPPPGPSTQDWFAERVNALAAMGQDEKATQMIESLPPSMMNDALRRTQAELTLAHGDTDAACKKAKQWASGSEDPFWQKLNILCLAYAGQESEAMVAIDVMHEQSHTDDLFFQDAIHAMLDKKTLVKSLPKQWTLFDVALLRLAGQADKLRDRLDAVPPLMLKYLAADASLDVKMREKATGRAQSLGILPVREGSRLPEQAFARALASDVQTLVSALKSSRMNGSDNDVIARLRLEDASIQDTRRVQRLVTLMEPFGYKVPLPVWQKLDARRNRFDGEVPPAALVSRLGEAAHSGRSGEVLLLSALIMNGSTADRIPDLALLPVVTALKAVGFEKEARAIAYDAVKGYIVR